MRPKGLHLTLACLLACSALAAPSARAASDYGYGAQSASSGAPLDLRAALSPVRKYDPQASAAARAARPPQPAAAAAADGSSSGAPADMPSPPAAPAPRRPDWLEPERAGAPYEAKGSWYVPTPDPGYAETGRAVAIDAAFEGRSTATGETYSAAEMTAAHPTLPLPSLVQVTDMDTGREIIVRVSDRGPFDGRGLIGLSPAALRALGAPSEGVDRVHVRYLGPAPRRVDKTGRDVRAKAVAAVAPPLSVTWVPISSRH